ncbi:MAG: OsmC family protein [Pseudomonadota bacterium]|nr:OsmC family protein [Pseudomonadota bacterium]
MLDTSSSPQPTNDAADDAGSKACLNGIDLDGVVDLVDAIKTGARCGRACFRVKTQWKGQTRTESTVESFTCAGEPIPRTFTIVSDEPTELLGTDSAPNPQELLLSAVNACMMVGYVAQAAVRGVTLTDCRIETDGELDLRGFLGLDQEIPAGYRRINYTVHLEGDGTAEQYDEIHRAVLASSPNYFNLAQPVQMCGRLT